MPIAYRRWLIFGISTSLFVLSQFYRATIAVITPELIRDLSLSTADLGLITSAFFYAFAFTQIPIGISLDRIGPRTTMTVLSFVAVAGSLLFAAAQSTAMLVAGRVLMGIGMACNLMGTFKLLTLWFSPRQFATLTALVFSIGTIGSMAAATPLVVMTSAIGWRSSFTFFAAVNFAIAICFYLFVTDIPPDSTDEHLPKAGAQSFSEIVTGLLALLKLKDYWIISFATCCHYGIWAAVQALWAGPYLMELMRLSPVTAGNVIFLMNIGIVLGGPLWGAMSDRWLATRKKVVVAGVSGTAVTLLAMALAPVGTGPLALTAIFVAFAFFRSSGGVMYAHIKEMVPLELAGTAMTGINFFTMFGAAIFLQGSGIFMQVMFPEASRGAEAFTGVYLICSLCLAVSGLLYLLTKETLQKAKPKPSPG